MSGGQPASPTEPHASFDIDALFQDWAPYRRIALAVSGGADSTALMLLAHDWLARRDAPPSITVLTVDHGLRPEAAREAARVRSRAEHLGWQHETLHWTSAKPRSGVQEAAREARYSLMLAFCRKAGIDALATAHTADDQAETVLMRLARGSGIDGLAGIPPRSERDGIALLRPLLGLARPQIETFLRERGEDWIEDPSNRDPAYERFRVRQTLQMEAQLQLKPDAIARSASRLHRARLALDTATDALLDAGLNIHPAGFGSLPLRALRDAPEEIALRSITRLAAMFGGGKRPVRLARVESLLRALTAGEPPRDATLGGCIFSGKKDVLFAIREYGRIAPAPVPLSPNGVTLWDGRFEISTAGEPDLAAGPLGPDGLALLRAAGGRIPLPARIAHSLPAIRRGADLVLVPFATFEEKPPSSWNPAIRAVFRPSHKGDHAALAD